MVDSVDEEVNSMSMARHKVVFVGDVSVGKTSIINRLVDNKFRDTYEPSIGVDFSSKILKCKGRSIKLQIWDSAGQERYKSLIPTYIRGASLIFIVFDITKRETFESVPNWIAFVKNYENTVIILCGNKLDLQERQVEYSEAAKLCDKEGLLYFEISAKTNENIKDMFYSSVTELPIFEKSQGSNKQKLINELKENNESQFIEQTISHEAGPMGLKIKNGKSKMTKTGTGKKAEGGCAC